MAQWQESDSQLFIDRGRIYTPRRDELAEAFLDAIPSTEDEPFLAVDIGSGAGWLTESILTRFSQARVIALDGSDAMQAATAEIINRFGERGEVRPFRLETASWRQELPDGLRAVVSSLVIHHLRGEEKQQLFRDLLQKLEPGGALLIADVVLPAHAMSGRHFERAWDADVARQSQEVTGSDEAYRQFLSDKWNMYAFPIDPEDIDHPSTVVQHVDWLREAGFAGVDILWGRAGHTLFCGYRP
jgi:tRNA (cmo5U34)-methyltransferase